MESSIGRGLVERASRLRTRFLVTLPFSVAVIVLSMVPALQFPGWQWVVALASLPVVTWGAAPFHRSAWKAGRHGTTTMDTLVSLGVVASSLWSWYALLLGGAGAFGAHMEMSFLPSGLFSADAASTGHTPAAHIYFEGACAIVSFLLAGRMMEARTRVRAGDAVRSLLETGVRDVSVVEFPLTAHPEVRTIPLAQLSVGEVFLVRPGEKVATDGVIVEGFSAVDASLMTGESLPVEVAPGTQVAGGSVNTWGLLYVRATAVGADTQVAHIARMVTQAQATKAPIQHAADRVSAVFVPVMLALSTLTLLVWLVLGFAPERAVSAAVAVLVVACPCALGLATPTALLVGSGRAAQLGIVIRSAEVLERSRRIDTVVFDKTGTLTTGVMSLDGILTNETSPAFSLPVASSVSPTDSPFSRSSSDLTLGQRQALGFAAGVEASSQHPIARALVRAADEHGITPLVFRDVRDYPGHGVCAQGEDGRLALVGRVSWLRSLGGSLSPELAQQIERAELSGATVVACAVGHLPEEVRGENSAVLFASASSADTWDARAFDNLSHSAREAGEASEELTVSENDDSTTVLVDMAVEGMTCASCVRRVERKLGKLPGVEAVVNLATDSALITVRGSYSDHELEEVVRAAGYEAQVRSRDTLSSPSPTHPEHSALPAHSAHSALSANDPLFSPLTQASPAAPANSAHRSDASPICEEISAAFVVRDRVKETSAQAIRDLEELGITPILLSGDQEKAAEFAARQARISTVIAGVMPEGKRDVICELQGSGRVVAMVGDGINDAPALAQAQVTGLGIAMGSGTDTAIAVADMTLMNSDPRSAATAIRLARRTLSVIYQNLLWAFGYNIIMVPLAMCGLLTPMIASAAMACSSLCVVANSLRLRTSR